MSGAPALTQTSSPDGSIDAQLIIARDIAKAPELTNLLKQCTKTVLGAGAFPLIWCWVWLCVGGWVCVGEGALVKRRRIDRCSHTRACHDTL